MARERDERGDVDTGDRPPRTGGGDAFENWYRDEIQAHPDKYDTGRSKEQWKAWFPLWTGKGFKSSKKDAQGNPIQGDDFEHPDACPAGTQAFGKDQCRAPGEMPGQAGGGPGSAPAPGTRPGGGPGGDPSGIDWAAIDQHFNPNDMGLSNIYQSLLSDPQMAQAFVAPQIENIAGDLDAARRNLMASMPEGGQKDLALQQLEQQGVGQAAQVRQNLIPAALTGMQGLYGQQLGAGTQRFGDVLGSLTNQLGQGTQLSIAGMDDATKRMLGLGQLGLGWGQLGEQGREFDTGLDWTKSSFGQNLDWQKNMFGQNFGEQQREFNQNQSNWQKQYDAQQKQANRGFWGNLFGGLGGILGGGGALATKLFSDAATKEEVKPYTPGLSALKKLKPVSYTYNEKAEDLAGEKAVSVVAQDLEKVLPDAVTKRADGLRMIDLAKVLMTTVNAVKELDRKIEKTRG